MDTQAPAEVTELLARSNRLGSDPRNTNYAGGNTSAKGLAADPVTGDHVELLWVKGSGGDLGTLTGPGLAAAADGEALTRDCFGDRVLWVPWRRPGFQLGLDIAAVARDNPRAIGVILGGHGITAWGATSAECEDRSLEIIATAQRYLDEHGSAEPFGPVLPGYEPLPEGERHARAAALAPVLRGLA